MDGAFSPYHAFLGLDEELAAPNYYQLLRLPEGEADEAKIAAAADRATTRVRGQRPGGHAAEWSRLLDEIKAARSCLLDAAAKADYDRRIGAVSNTGGVKLAARQADTGGLTSPARQAEGAPSIAFVATPQPAGYAYPPGVGPQAGPTVAAGKPSEPEVGPFGRKGPLESDTLPPAQVPLGKQDLQQFVAGLPTEPQARHGQEAGQSSVPTLPQPAYPPSSYPSAVPVAPAGPTAYSWSPPPASPGPTAAPHLAPTGSNAFDPMAPVAFPARVEPAFGAAAAQPFDHRVVGFAGGIVPGAGQSQVPFATAAPVAVPVATPVNPAYGVAAAGQPLFTPRPSYKKPSKVPLWLVGGGGLLVLILAGLAGFWWMNRNKQLEEDLLAENEQTDQYIEEDAQPAPAPKPQTIVTPPKPEPAPMPKPEPGGVTPKPEPMPETNPPKPEPEPVKPATPAPEPKPEPKPEPPPKSDTPTASELAELSKLMKDAKTALGDFNFEEAETALVKAEQLAKLPDHRAKVLRLKRISEMAQQFRQAIVQTLSKLEAGEVIKIGTSTQAAIVESSPNKLVIRISGENRSYAIDELPLGLAVNLGERSLNADNPQTRVLKGAYVFIDKRSDAGQIKKAKAWWEEAELSGVDVREILPVLTDKYDFEKDLPKE